MAHGDLFSSGYEFSSVQDFLIIYGAGDIFSWDLKGNLYGIKAKNSFSICMNSLEPSTTFPSAVQSRQRAHRKWVGMDWCMFARVP